MRDIELAVEVAPTVEPGLLKSRACITDMVQEKGIHGLEVIGV